MTWDESRQMLWRAMVQAWPEGLTIGPSDPKMHLAEAMLPKVLGWCFSHHADYTLLADCRQLAIEAGRPELAHRIVLAMVNAMGLEHPRPEPVKIPPTPAWFIWVNEHVYGHRPEHNPEALARRFQFLADEVQRRAKHEGYHLRDQAQLELVLEDPGRPFD